MVTYRLLKPVRWGRKLIRIRASASAPAALGLSCPYYPGRRRSIATAVAPHTTTIRPVLGIAIATLWYP